MRIGYQPIFEPLMLLIVLFLVILMADFCQKYMCRIITCTSVNRLACGDEVVHMNLKSQPKCMKPIDSS